MTLITYVKVHFLLGTFANPCPSIAVLRRPHIPFAPRDNRPRFIIITATPALGGLCRRRRRCRRRWGRTSLLIFCQTTAVTGRTGSIWRVFHWIWKSSLPWTDTAVLRWGPRGPRTQFKHVLGWIYNKNSWFFFHFQPTLLKPSPKTKHSPKNVLKLSPESSRSSSWNSSVSSR